MMTDRSITGRLVSFGAVISEIAIALLMLHVTAQVVLRLVFNISLENTPEIVSYYYMSGLIFMSLGLVTLYDSHIAASLFTEMMPAPVQKTLMVVVLFVLAGVALLLAWEMGREALKMTQIGEIHIGSMSNLPKWPARWFLPLGFTLMALAAVVRARRIHAGEVEAVIGRDVRDKPEADEGND
ncbi:MAG: TRAP transporter small permease [Pseudomonadota bacterium]